MYSALVTPDIGDGAPRRVRGFRRRGHRVRLRPRPGPGTRDLVHGGGRLRPGRMQLATNLSTKFSIIEPLRHWIPKDLEFVRKYGHEQQLASFAVCEPECASERCWPTTRPTKRPSSAPAAPRSSATAQKPLCSCAPRSMGCSSGSRNDVRAGPETTGRPRHRRRRIGAQVRRAPGRAAPLRLGGQQEWLPRPPPADELAATMTMYELDLPTAPSGHAGS